MLVMPARRGRPPFPKAKLRTVKVLVSLSPGEARAIRAAAGDEPVAAWLREVGLRAARRRAK